MLEDSKRGKGGGKGEKDNNDLDKGQVEEHGTQKREWGKGEDETRK